MPARRYIVYPQGGGHTYVPPTPYNYAADPALFRKQALGFGRGKTRVNQSVHMLLSAGGTTPLPPSVGVMAGANGRIVSTLDGTTPVYLTLIGVQGGEFGYTYMPGIVAMTSAQWTAAFLQQYNYLKGLNGTTVANTYADFNCVRLYLNSAAYTGASGRRQGVGETHTPGSIYRTLGTNLDGTVIYCAGDTGGTVGTHDGTETDGSGATYQGYIDTFVNNVLGASSPLGNATYVILNLDWTTPVNAANGQKILPCSQPAALSPVDLAMWISLAAKYKNNPRVIFEFQNEPYYSTASGGGLGNGGTALMNYESTLLGNGNNGGASSFTWPDATSKADSAALGTAVNSYVVNFSAQISPAISGTCVSYQQVLNAVRAQGATNLVFLGTLVNSGAIYNWSQNGGTQSVTDPYTVDGVQQYAAILHSYGYNGTSVYSNGKTGAQNITGLIAAGTPFVLDEYGTATTVGSTGSNGYSWMKANGVSGHGMTCVANFGLVSNIYNQGSYSATGLNWWSNYNVPNPSSAASQIPTGSN